MRRPREVESIFGKDGTVKFDKEEYTYIDVDELVEHPDHKFSLHEGLKMQKLVESVKCAGVLHAVLVSERDGKKYLLAGYNRVHACRVESIQKVPAIIKRELSRIQEVQIINFTNFFPGNEDDYSLRTRVRALKAEYDALIEDRKNSTIDYQKQRTREYFAELYEMTDSKMQRFLSLDKLSDGLLECVDMKRINMSVALIMTNLSLQVQNELYDYLLTNDQKISIEDANKIVDQLNHHQEIDVSEKKKEVKLKKMKVSIDPNLESILPKGKEQSDVISNTIKFTYEELPQWLENHKVNVDSESVFDYILELLSKVYEVMPELF